MGFVVDPGHYKDLHQYFISARPDKLLQCVRQIGWHGNAFILPDATYGADQNIILQNPATDSLFKVNGQLAAWQHNIGRLCENNSRLVLGCCVALAAPLLKVCGFESGGFHFMGNSSTGKSTCLLVAGSICGGGGQQGFIRRWRATDNALEYVALAHNDSLLCLDEIGQLAARAVSETAYMLANGQGKARASKDGAMRSINEWRLLFLSSGEISLEQKILEDGRQYMAGQAVRVVSVPADAGAGMGIFEDLHEFTEAKAMAEHLQAAITEHYGTPLRAFLKYLTSDFNECKGLAHNMMQEFERNTSPGADGQVKRVSRRMALLAAAGELAIAMGILPWPAGHAFKAIQRCLNDWVLYRGGLGAAEVMTAINQVKAFIVQHGQSRFEPWDECQMVANRVGYRREANGEVQYLFYPEAFKSVVCAGLNHLLVVQYLIKAGYLEPDSNGNAGRAYKLPREATTARLYTVKAAILSYPDNQR